MNILIITTGGTIGSKVADGFISPDPESCSMLIEKYRVSEKNLMPDDTPVSFDFTCPYTILSENLDGGHINKLISFITEQLNTEKNGRRTDGIIVTHGTDTLQYTAAALAYAFYDSDIPIIMISSNYILDDSRANGVSNLLGAVLLIKHISLGRKKQCGVFVSYKNEGEPIKLHRASRLLPHMPYSDRLYSIDDRIYGIIENGKFIPKETDADRIPNNASLSMRDIRLISPSPVLYIRPVPSQPLPITDMRVRAILLDAYHSGTLGTSCGDFRAYIKKACAKSTPVFLTGAENRVCYESTKLYKGLHINVLPKAAPYAMYMKLWFLTSAYASELPISEIYKNYACEFV